MKYMTASERINQAKQQKMIEHMNNALEAIRATRRLLEVTDGIMYDDYVFSRDGLARAEEIVRSVRNGI